MTASRKPKPPPPKPKCPPGECVCLDVTFGNAGFWVYRCVRCGTEEWL